MNIGIFGGTFDPPHLGHLGIATSALNTGKIDRVIFVPTSTPPHKTRLEITPSQHRYNMTEILVAGSNNLFVSNIELERKGISYTYLTLKDFHKSYPNDNFRLIIGADMALSFDTWKNAEDIIYLAPPLIAARPGYKFSSEFGITLPKDLPKTCRKRLKSNIFSAPLWNISSTEIRDLMSTGNDQVIDKYLPLGVYEYIVDNKLYI